MHGLCSRTVEMYIYISNCTMPWSPTWTIMGVGLARGGEGVGFHPSRGDRRPWDRLCFSKDDQQMKYKVIWSCQSSLSWSLKFCPVIKLTVTELDVTVVSGDGHPTDDGRAGKWRLCLSCLITFSKKKEKRVKSICIETRIKIGKAR